MTDTAELRHVLSFIQSHLDKHNVVIEELGYESDNHIRYSPDSNGVRDLDVTGTTVRLSVEYTFNYDE